MKMPVLLLFLVQGVLLYAQNKPLHGKIKNFNADKTLESIKEYDHGKRTGTWTTYYKLYKTDIYINSVLTIKKLHNYMGQDSIVEKLDADRTFIKIYPLDAITNSIKAPEAYPVELNSDNDIFISTDQKAGFMGGEDSLSNFLASNITYPQAKQKGMSGTAVVVFIIEIDGKTSAVKIAKSSGWEDFDAEAVKVIKKTSLLWIPGKINGKTVRSYCQIPITFELE